MPLASLLTRKAVKLFHGSPKNFDSFDPEFAKETAFGKGFSFTPDEKIAKNYADLSPKEIASKWIDEFEDGIKSSGIKPGFIKLAFDDGVPSSIDLKLFEAGVITHQHTGLTRRHLVEKALDRVKPPVPAYPSRIQSPPVALSTTKAAAVSYIHSANSG